MKTEPGDLQETDLKEGMRVIYRVVRFLAKTPSVWKRTRPKTTTHSYHPFYKKRGSKVTTKILTDSEDES